MIGAVEEWVFFETPTPGAQNEAIFYANYVMSVPSFSKPGGLMVGAQSIELSTDFGGNISQMIVDPMNANFFMKRRSFLKGTRSSEQPFLSLISFLDP